MPRITRIAGSFAIVVIAYWAYALLAVPWIEPSADLRSGGVIPPGIPRDPVAPGLGALFPPDAWELKSPLMLESDRAKLLFQKYSNRSDGSVKIDPCTIVFAHEGPADDEAQRRRQSVILEAPDGALLQFDQPLDLNRAKIGRLVAGQLKGKVTIRSDWKEPGPEDDLWIETRDIQLTEQTISTPNPVKFQWGPHFGNGQDMVIKLLPGRPQPGMEGSGPNIAGIESFELRRVERLHLDLGPAPVEINCRGPFRFDVVKRVATFQDRVDVLKSNPSGPADQIACELLSLYFTQRRGMGGSPPIGSGERPKEKAVQAGSLDLAAERIEARGNPVVVTAPSQNVTSRAERLEYNLLANSIALSGGREVFLRQGPNEIHARSLHYQSAGPGRLGRVAAQGPGWLRGRSPDRPDQQLEAVWKDQLRVFPAEREQVISLTGGAELKFQGVGQLQAREIFFWLLEMPPAAKNQQSRVRPDRMLALSDVHMNSPQLSSKVERLEVWFEEKAEGGGRRAEDAFSGRRNDGLGAAVQLPPQQAQRGLGGSPPSERNDPSASSQPPAGAAVQLPPQPGTAQPGMAPQRFEVVGRLLRARVLLGQQQAAVSNLTIEDGVRFVETQTARPDERPLVIRGDRLEAVDAAAPNAAITVTGRPARFEGRGLGLTGSNINLNRGTNRLWINGAGQMDLPMSAAVQGQAPAAPGVLTVDWRRRMEFDGRTAQFEESVVAATPQQQLRTETMRVQLQRPIRFSEPNMQGTPQVEEIGCSGGVSMESRTFDQQQQLSAHDQMQVTDLRINRLNGEINGGPGWLNSVRRGSDNPWGSAAVPAASGGQDARAPGLATGPKNAASQNQLNCLHVRFQESITGNLLRRQLTFRGQVQTTYAPVDNWDAMITTTDPDKLGPSGVVVHCDRLSVVEMLLPMRDRRAIELEALGNTVVEGTTFFARGNRITYAETKDLLILEGDGRNNAELWRQLQVGAPTDKHAAQKIFYWPKTKRLNVVGAQSLEIGQPPNGSRTR